MSWDLSIVIIVPAELREKANRLTCALGYDNSPVPGRTFSIPLSADGVEPATHYGCRTPAKTDFVDIVAAAGNGVLPDWLDLEAYGLTEQDVAGILAINEDGRPVMIMDVRDAVAMVGHFEDVTAAYGFLRCAEAQE